MAFQHGSVAMANSGKNSNTSQVRRRTLAVVDRRLLIHTLQSQFFITLASSPAQLAKLSSGKYVAFGQVDVSIPSHCETLDRLSALADGKSGTTVPVWISACSVYQS